MYLNVGTSEVLGCGVRFLTGLYNSITNKQMEDILATKGSKVRIIDAGDETMSQYFLLACVRDRDHNSISVLEAHGFVRAGPWHKNPHPAHKHDTYKLGIFVRNPSALPLPTVQAPISTPAIATIPPTVPIPEPAEPIIVKPRRKPHVKPTLDPLPVTPLAGAPLRVE